jgi:endonuclease-8
LMLHHNREQAGQVTTGDNRPGRQHWVFERVGRPCRRCGSSIRCETFGPLGRERLSYWCPTCQPVHGTVCR